MASNQRGVILQRVDPTVRSPLDLLNQAGFDLTACDIDITVGAHAFGSDRSDVIVEVVGGGAAPVIPPENHTEGLISEWLFNDGAGNIIADSVGSNDVDMSAVTGQSFTHESFGIRMTGGSFVTPRIDAGRTMVALVRTPYQQTGGFMMSGGTASNQGILQGQGYANGNMHIGGGFGVHLPRTNSNVDSQNAWETNAGGLVLMFMEPTAGAIDTVWCLGGRAQASNTSNRCGQLDVVWAALYDDVLTDSERTEIYEYAAFIARQRSVYLRCIDCPVQRDAVLITGESTAEGRSNTNTLPTEQQTQVFDNTNISVQQGSNNTPQVYPPPVFDLGVNNTSQNASIWHGPELSFAQKAETADRDLIIIKSADGSTQIAPTNVDGAGNPATNLTWYPDAGFSTLFHDLLANFYYTEQYFREQGIGLVFLGYHMDIGLNDAQDVDFAASDAVYQGYLQDFYNQLIAYTNVADFRVHMTLPHDRSASSNKIALARIRQAIQNFILARGALGHLTHIDVLTYYDGTHTNQSLYFGDRAYDWLVNGEVNYDYHISGASGSDANAGTSPAAAWASTAPLNALLTTIDPDTVLDVLVSADTYLDQSIINQGLVPVSGTALTVSLEAGTVFQETSNAVDSCVDATTGMTMTLRKIGVGANPRITGFDTSTGNGLGASGSGRLLASDMDVDGCIDGVSGHATSHVRVERSNFSNCSKAAFAHVNDCTAEQYYSTFDAPSGSSLGIGADRSSNADQNISYQCAFTAADVGETLEFDAGTVQECQLGTLTQRLTLQAGGVGTGADIIDSFINIYHDGNQTGSLTECFGFYSSRQRSGGGMQLTGNIFRGPATGISQNSALYANFDGGQDAWNATRTIFEGYGDCIGEGFNALRAGYFETAGNTVTYCALFNNTRDFDADLEATSADITTGNITTDPLLGTKDTYVKEDWGVQVGSPCLGAGPGGLDIGFASAA